MSTPTPAPAAWGSGFSRLALLFAWLLGRPLGQQKHEGPSKAQHGASPFSCLMQLAKAGLCPRAPIQDVG